jgi:hypothetical protein
LKVQRALSRRRRQLLTLRAHIQNERTLLAQKRDHDIKTREAVIEAITSALERGTLVDDLAMIKALQQKSLVSNCELNEGAERFSELQGRLSTLEYRLGKKEEELCSPLGHQQVGDEALEDDDSASQVEDLESTDQSESENLPSLLEEYYDRAGDVNVEWDRLQELESDHRHEIALRTRNAAEGRPLAPSEEDFVGQYFEKRSKIIRDFLQAKTDARELRRQCVEQNYSIQDDGSTKDMEHFDLSKRKTELELSGTFDLLADDGNDRRLQLLLVGEANRMQRVQEWLNGTVHTQSSSMAAHRLHLWHSRKTYSENGWQPQMELEIHLAEVQSEAGPELRIQGQAPISEPQIVAEEMEYPQTWPALTRVGSGLNGACTTTMWGPEVSLQRRYSSPELRQIFKNL